MPTRDLFAQIPLFASLGPEQLDRLAALVRPHRYRAGQVVFHEGDAGTALYIIEGGEVKIVLGSSAGKEVVRRGEPQTTVTDCEAPLRTAMGGACGDC